MNSNFPVEPAAGRAVGALYVHVCFLGVTCCAALPAFLPIGRQQHAQAALCKQQGLGARRVQLPPSLPLPCTLCHLPSLSRHALDRLAPCAIPSITHPAIHPATHPAGENCLPANGIGAVADQMAARLPARALRLSTRAAAVAGGAGGATVMLEGGESLQAKAVVRGGRVGGRERWWLRGHACQEGGQGWRAGGGCVAGCVMVYVKGWVCAWLVSKPPG